jgi:hypothetical protein
MPEPISIQPEQTPIPATTTDKKIEQRRKLFLALGIVVLLVCLSLVAAWRLSTNQNSGTSTPAAASAPEIEVEILPVPVAEIEAPRRVVYVVGKSGNIMRGEEHYEIHLTDTLRSFDETIYSTKSLLRNLGWRDTNTLIIHDSSYQNQDLNATYYLKEFNITTRDPLMIDSSSDYNALNLPYLKAIKEPIYTPYQFDEEQKTTAYTLHLLVGSEFRPVYTWTMGVGIGHAPYDMSFGNWDQSPDAKHYLGYLNAPLLDETQPDLIIFDAEGQIVDTLQHPSVSNANFISDTEIIFKENTDIFNSTDGKLFKYNFVTKSLQEIGPYSYSQTSVDILSRSIIAMQHYPYTQAKAPDVIVLDLDTFAIKQTFPSSALQNEDSDGLYMISGAVFDNSTSFSLYRVISKMLLENDEIKDFIDIPEGIYIRISFEPSWDE